MDSPITDQQLTPDREQKIRRNYADFQPDGTVPLLLGEIDRGRARVADLEGPAVEARAALASLCCDLEDPGTAALGALHLISRVTVGVEAPRDDAAQALARHDAQIMRRCAEFVRDTYSGEWADDAAATLERDADVAERGCPGYGDAGRGDTVAERQLANCKHCGRPRAACLAASAPPAAPLSASQPSSVSESAQSPAGTAEGALRDPQAPGIPQPTEDLASADNPTHLRWGLNDVLWSDDDSVIVMLSGPDREAYWLELDPERAAVLREDLAGSAKDPAPAEEFTDTQPCGHDDYHDPHPWRDRPDVTCPGHSYDDDHATA